MRLADFILANVEPILAEWQVYARSIWPPATVATVSVEELRDDAVEILRATALDMQSAQSTAQQSAKSKGNGHHGEASHGMDRAATKHGTGRVSSGFHLWAVIAEFRALRASVLRLWRESGPTPDLHDLDDLTRFNESMDQSLTESVRAYGEEIERDRAMMLANEMKVREDAEDANRAKDTFLATLSHEMRTPLTAIAGWLSILRKEGVTEQDRAEGLKVIQRNTRAQAKLIDDVLDVSRIVSGKLRLDIGPCELNDVINAGVDAIRPSAEAKGITVNLRLEPKSSRASCDAVRMQQVVWNLVSNAIKFTPKGGAITVALTQETSKWRITISDTGTGIDREFLPHVFDRFRQADSSMRRKFGGLGLGLSIVKHLVEAHGGSVEAYSAGEGRGSTFTVWLPIHAVRIDSSPKAVHDQLHVGDAEDDSSSNRGRGPDMTTVRLDGLRVMLVDDDADTRDLLMRVLRDAGAEVTAATSGSEALDTLSSARPDVLVSDIGMPEMDGLQFIREVRRRGFHAKDLPAVALTAFAHKDDHREAIRAGFQVHLPKPVGLHDLTAVIASLGARGGGAGRAG